MKRQHEPHGHLHHPIYGPDPIPGVGTSTVDFCTSISSSVVDVSGVAFNGVIGLDVGIDYNTNSTYFTYDATNDAININAQGVYEVVVEATLQDSSGRDPTEAWVDVALFDDAAAPAGAYFWMKRSSQARFASGAFSIAGDVGDYVSPGVLNGDAPRCSVILPVYEGSLLAYPLKIKTYLITNTPGASYTRFVSVVIVRYGDCATPV